MSFKKLTKFNPDEIFNGDLVSYVLFTDGACKGNPGNGSYGVAIYDSHLNLIQEINGKRYKNVTNQLMEIYGIGVALKWLTEVKFHKAYIVSDSAYCLNSVTSWIYNWMNTDFKNGLKFIR